MSKTARTVIEIILAIGCIIFIILFVLQMQNNQQTQEALQLSQLEGTGAALKGNMAQTEAAGDVNDAQATVTQSAQEAATVQAQLVYDSQSTATQSAQEAATAQAQILQDSQSTATQSAQLLNDSQTTQTQVAMNAPVGSGASAEQGAALTQSASDLIALQGTATQSMQFVQATEFALAQEFAQINAAATQGAALASQEEIEQLNEIIQEQATEITFYFGGLTNAIGASQTLVTGDYQLILPEGMVGYDLTSEGAEETVASLSALGAEYEDFSAQIQYMIQSESFTAIAMPLSGKPFGIGYMDGFQQQQPLELILVWELPIPMPLTVIESQLTERGVGANYVTINSQIYTANTELNDLVFNQDTLRVNGDTIEGGYDILYYLLNEGTVYIFWYSSTQPFDETRIARIDAAIAQNLTFNN